MWCCIAFIIPGTPRDIPLEKMGIPDGGPICANPFLKGSRLYRRGILEFGTRKSPIFNANGLLHKASDKDGPNR